MRHSFGRSFKAAISVGEGGYSGVLEILQITDPIEQTLPKKKKA